jgi:hypothetical protein
LSADLPSTGIALAANMRDLLAELEAAVSAYA